MSGAVNEIRTDFGLSARDEIVFEYMLHAALYIQLGARGFEHPQRDLPDHVRFVGPVRPMPVQGWTEPDWWPDLDAGKPVVVLNQGTVATDPTELLQPGLAALADEDVLVVAVTGGRDPRELGPLPKNARVERYIPFDRLLPKADVLVTNAGFGAVQLALAAGVPIVAAGKTEDKVEVAARVVWSGVGINLRTQRPRQEAITAAVRHVLSNDRFRRRARELQAEIASAAVNKEQLMSWVSTRPMAAISPSPAKQPSCPGRPVSPPTRSPTDSRRTRTHEPCDAASALDGRGRPGDQHGLDDLCPCPDQRGAAAADTHSIRTGRRSEAWPQTGRTTFAGSGSSASPNRWSPPLALQEVASRRWSLSTTVGSVLPGLLPGHDQITVEQLLSHRSGLPDYLTPIIGGAASPQQAIDLVSVPRTDHELVSHAFDRAVDIGARHRDEPAERGQVRSGQEKVASTNVGVFQMGSVRTSIIGRP